MSSMDRVRLDRFRDGELTTVTRLYNELIAGMPCNWPVSAAEFADEVMGRGRLANADLPCDPATLLIASVAGTAAGFVHFHRLEECGLIRFLTFPEGRAGIGTALLNAAVDRLCRTGCTRIEAWQMGNGYPFYTSMHGGCWEQGHVTNLFLANGFETFHREVRTRPSPRARRSRSPTCRSASWSGTVSTARSGSTASRRKLADAMGLPHGYMAPGHMNGHVVSYQLLLHHMLYQIKSLGFRVIFMLYGHYPLVYDAQPVAREFMEANPGIRVYAGMESDPIRDAFPESEHEEFLRPFHDKHAGKWETSILKTLRPDVLVPPESWYSVNRHEEASGAVSIRRENPRGGSFAVERRGI